MENGEPAELPAAHLVHERLQLLALLLGAQRVDGDQLLRKAPQLLQLPPVPRHRRARARDAVQERQLRVRVTGDICRFQMSIFCHVLVIASLRTMLLFDRSKNCEKSSSWRIMLSIDRSSCFMVHDAVG